MRKFIFAGRIWDKNLFRKSGLKCILILPNNRFTIICFLCQQHRKKTAQQAYGIKIIRSRHGCEGWIEKAVPMITDWHHEACRVMTNGDREERILLSHPHTNNGFFFLLTTKYLIFCGWGGGGGGGGGGMKRLPENPEYAEV